MRDTSTVVEKEELIDRVVEAVAQGSASSTPTPPDGYAPDTASGYYYSEASGLYWDPKSGGFYDGRSGLWYRWDAASAQFVEWKP
ncbi:hypothetical protein QBZ16_003652 [Prototheca wickerhamii]|uniref:OCRE domain-containing protein n=1 Tax=Prototheca wickerhamii TaxID=3111 RepID=A0AAD9MIR0_PROWI|nr:hypothetical protein QBZ16_003652 [Prototheca wickerhamii]